MFLLTTIRELGVHSSSVKGPLPTRLPGRAHGVSRLDMAPNTASARGLTGKSGGWATSAARYGVGRSSSIRTVRVSGAVMPRAPGSDTEPLLNASAFLMG